MTGVHYPQKTKKAPCDEMKEDSYMETYVMEAGLVSRCNLANQEFCSDKEKEYIAKYQGKDISDAVEQAARLTEMSLTKDAKQSITGYKWLAARRALLKQLVAAGGANSEL